MNDNKKPETGSKTTDLLESNRKAVEKKSTEPAKEYGGRKNGTDPTRYGDWEKNGRCIDF